MRLLPWLAFCSLSAPAAALQLQMLEASREGGVYHVTVDALIDAPPARVRTVLLDWQALPTINPNIQSVSTSALPDGTRVESELEECLFGLCRRLRQVQIVREDGNEIRAETLPVQGSFKSGTAHWQLDAAAQGTRLRFTASTEPDVWLPPLIGPRRLMQQLREKTEASLHTVERLARE